MSKTLLLESEKRDMELRLEELSKLNLQYLDDRKRAAEEGDFSENFAYEQANKNLADVKREVTEIQDILKDSEILKDDKIDRSRVSIGVKVTFERIGTGQSWTLLFVSADRGSVAKKRISSSSEIGKALEGRQVGDVVDVTTTDGIQHSYKIVGLE